MKFAMLVLSDGNGWVFYRKCSIRDYGADKLWSVKLYRSKAITIRQVGFNRFSDYLEHRYGIKIVEVMEMTDNEKGR